MPLALVFALVLKLGLVVAFSIVPLTSGPGLGVVSGPVDGKDKFEFSNSHIINRIEF